jgi:signal transduction histidine kinase/CheY-like chemotaxis protein
MISSIALIFACAAFVVIDQFMFKKILLRDLSMLSKIIGENCTAALVFDDEYSANETLAALKAKKNIVSACIYEKHGKVFAKYSRDNIKINFMSELPENECERIEKNKLIIFQPIKLEGEKIGNIFILSDLKQLYSRSRSYFIIIIVVLFISFLAIYFMSLKLHRIVSDPILNLAKVAKEVSLKEDYSIRVEKTSQDELGFLTERFNEMLIQIQEREDALQKVRDELEEHAQELQKELVEKKRAEKEKTNLQAQLLQAQKMEAVGILAGGVAHDFNNLLTAIRGCADIAMFQIEDSSSLFQDIKEIQVATDRAADLTRQLLLFSRKQPMAFVSLDLNDSIENLLKIFYRIIGENIKIHTELESEIWTINADRGTIEQVILNLVVNAKDAMPKGGKLCIKTENIVLEESYCKQLPDAKPGKFVRLSVSDTGVGMDKKTVQHIFEPFFSTKGVGKGTGLGLSVIYGIVKQHGGWINVYSEIDHGSVFKVYLPAASGKPVKKVKECIVMKKLKGKGEKILVIEDEQNVRNFTERALNKAGYYVFLCETLEEARNVFKQENGKFHLVFSDVVLPDGNGINLVDEFIRQKPDLRILLSSGYADKKSRWDIIRKRGFRFLQKPYALADLLQTIREIITQKKMFQV